jgi:hypothetical protein
MKFRVVYRVPQPGGGGGDPIETLGAAHFENVREVQTEVERQISDGWDCYAISFAPVDRRRIEVGNVVDNPSFGKYCAITQEQADQANAEGHIFVCEKAHDDGSFAYLCGGSYCRCCQ